MRITQSTITRNYLRNMNNNNKAKFDSANRITSGAKFTRASQDPISAAKALNVRKSLHDLNTYKNNLNTGKTIYGAAEAVIMNISEILNTITEKVVFGVNGTQGDTGKTIIAQEIDGYADQMLRLFNSNEAGRKIFGGENNETAAFAFEENPDGTKSVLYNGVDINSSDNPKDFPYSDVITADIGLGIKIGADGKVDPQTGLQISFNGAEVTGSGVDADGLSNNYIQLALDVANALKSGDEAKALQISEKIEASKNHLYISIADIGNAERFIDFNLTKITNEEFNLQERQNDLEATDLPAEMTYYKVLSATYSATLQMATAVIPQSIFNFMK